MKILLINKFHYIKGGADRHYLELGNLLTSKGHEVIYFSMNESNNANSDWVEYIDLSSVRFNWQSIKVVCRMFYSLSAKRKLEKLILRERPDIAHLHNIYHQISPSIIRSLKKYNIPTVMTVHDYYLVSPEYNLFADGKLLDYKKNQYLNIIKNRLIKKSFLASIVSCAVHWVHSIWGLYRQIDIYICPSKFMAKVMVHKISSNKIIVLPNFSNFKYDERSEKKNFLLFVGRISAEKGVEQILRLAGLLPNIEFRIVGEGPQKDWLMTRYDLSNVQWLGKLESEEINRLMIEARALLAPSQWYENNPLVILESLSVGTPVIASRLGGIPEIIKDGVNGFLFKHDDINDFKKSVQNIITATNYSQMSRYALDSAKDMTAERYYLQLMNIYESLVK